MTRLAPFGMTFGAAVPEYAAVARGDPAVVGVNAGSGFQVGDGDTATANDATVSVDLLERYYAEHNRNRKADTGGDEQLLGDQA
ncbi:MAG: hypothetical protein M1482_05650 [Chloroflexi bacterium]|nr:hypothetical protein [Chloroflexota bacterium]